MPAFRLALMLAATTAAAVAERPAWTTSHLHGSPEPPSPYLVERAFPKLTFSEPIEGAMLPGTNRLVVAGLRGKIVSFPDDPSADHTDDFADMKQWNPEVTECYSITFHPRFTENRLAFVWVNLDGHGKPNRADGTRIVRARVTTDQPPRLDLSTAVEVFTCMSGGHNGGNLRFGPDGMLYLGLGDTEVPDPPDSKVTGQDISDVQADILRLDVDHEDAGRHYAIPKDNPFANTPGARGEVWAYGLRNPWRLAFSPEGELWVGDVGWELWESIIHVQKGGNYGWSITEAGKQDVRPDRQRGPTPILKPTYVHSHEEACSITCGEFYGGSRLPELRGQLLYGDWQTGTFWSLAPKADGTVDVREMCRSPLLPAGFLRGEDGEVYACDQFGGGLWRFARNPEAGQPSKFPRRLSETGLFSDTSKQTAAAGVIPITLRGTRWVALPGTSTAVIAEKEKGVVAKGRWDFPTDTVFAKTYAIEVSPGVQRKIETQVLHYDGIQWGAYPYRWNDEQTDAELVGPKGAESTLMVNGQPQTWRFFARSECLRCHNMWTNFTPGFTAGELAPEELARLVSLGVVPETKIPEPAYAAAGAPGAPETLNAHAREYLNANCGTCHRFGGGGSVRIMLDGSVKLADMRIVNEPPVQGALGLDDARLIAPGDPARSVIIQRMATGGRGHMPYLGARSVDPHGLTLLRDWIAAMPRVAASPAVEKQRAADAAALRVVRAAAPSDPVGKDQMIDQLLATGSGALDLALALADGSLGRGGAVRWSAITHGAALADPLRRDLFEHYLPFARRRHTLGLTFDREALLARSGDAARGRAQFVAVCTACHRHGTEGRDFGPDLTHIGAKYAPAALLEQIVEPAKVIEPAWQLTVVELKDGTTQSGFVSERTDAGLTLRLADGTAAKIPAAGIAKTSVQRVSVMPEGLLAGLTPQEAADLLAFLSGK